jgi:hypothetical protein
MIINFLSRISDCVVMRWDRHSLTAFGGIAALVIGGALLLEDAEINPRRWGIRPSETQDAAMASNFRRPRCTGYLIAPTGCRRGRRAAGRRGIGSCLVYFSTLLALASLMKRFASS